jgi:hypothetical protein
MCLPGGSRDGQLVLSLAAGQLGLDLLTTSIMVMARGVDPSWLALEIEPVRAVVQVTLFLPCFSFLCSSYYGCLSFPTRGWSSVSLPGGDHSPG